MLIVDFPPEIFQSIIHELVTSAGIHKAWKLRKISRAFACEIFNDVYAKQPLSAFSIWPFKEFLALQFDRPLYIQNKLNNPLDARADVVRMCNEMITFLFGQLRLTTPAEEETCRFNFCNYIANFELHSEFRSGLFPKDHSWTGNDSLFPIGFSGKGCAPLVTHKLTVLDKIAVLAGIGEYEAMRELLPSLEDVSDCSIFGDPLINASMLGCRRTVRHLIEHPPTIKAMMAKPASRHHDRPIDDAIGRAFRKGHLEIIRDLIEVHEACRRTTLSALTYSSWLRGSIHSRDLDLIKTILKVRIGRHRRVSHRTFQWACCLGRAEICAVLIGPYQAESGKKAKKLPPIVAAVRSGNLNVIQTFADADVDIDALTIQGTKGYSALQVALQKNDDDAIRFLLDRNAALPELRLWPKKKKTYCDMLRNAYKTRCYKGDVPKYKDFRKMTFEDFRKMTFERK